MSIDEARRDEALWEFKLRHFEDSRTFEIGDTDVTVSIVELFGGGYELGIWYGTKEVERFVEEDFEDAYDEFDRTVRSYEELEARYDECRDWVEEVAEKIKSEFPDIDW